MRRSSVVTVDLVETNILDDVLSLLHQAISHAPEGVKQEILSMIDSMNSTGDSKEE